MYSALRPSLLAQDAPSEKEYVQFYCHEEVIGDHQLFSLQLAD